MRTWAAWVAVLCLPQTLQLGFPVAARGGDCTLYTRTALTHGELHPDTFLHELVRTQSGPAEKSALVSAADAPYPMPTGWLDNGGTAASWATPSPPPTTGAHQLRGGMLAASRFAAESDTGRGGGARGEGGGAACGERVPPVLHGRSASPTYAYGVAVGDMSMTTNGKNNAAGGMYCIRKRGRPFGSKTIRHGLSKTRAKLGRGWDSQFREVPLY
jgi:hypothetical protein